MEKLAKGNRDFNALFVLEHIFGKNLTIKNIVTVTGSSYG
jgi:hypothetical protein